MNDFWRWYNDFAAPKLAGRTDTFRKMFEYLDRFDRPVHILETGCIEEPDNWAGNGCSTLLFDKYALNRRDGSRVHSVDIDNDKVMRARRLTSPRCTKIVRMDSIKFLHTLAPHSRRPIDLLYLDASDLHWYHPVPSALHHLNELMKAMPLLRPDSLVVVDDSPAFMDETPRLEVTGKGEFVARYAFSVGADLEFCEYQVGFTHITEPPQRQFEAVHLESLIERARAHVEAGRLLAADPLYRLVLILTKPELLATSAVAKVARGEACAHYARRAREVGAFGRAADWYQQALIADPRAAEYRLELASKVYLRMGKVEHAANEAKKATKIEPLHAPAWQQLGSLRHENRDMEGAVEALDRALELDPANPDIIMDRAVVAIDLADYDKTSELCARALGGARHGDALHVLAMVAYRQSRHEDAIHIFDQALADKTTRAPAMVHWHKSHPVEAIGRWPEAWPERAWRARAEFRPELALSMNRFKAPLWQGEGWDDHADRQTRIHVHTEAGAGDNLCLVRYLPLIKAQGYDVCYEATPDMVDLIKGSFPDIEVVPTAADFPGSIGLKPFDYHIPVGELQNVFKTTIEDAQAMDIPYIKADPDRIEKYRDRLSGYKKKIGLCWSSGVRLDDSYWLKIYGQMKSMHFNDLLRILERQRPGEAYLSLQVGPEREQQRAYQHLIGDLLPKKPDWSETAALVANLDLVITVDTSVAHLAGAMGKPVWVLMQEDGASWHFLCARPGKFWNKRSPWYPTAQLFRKKRGDNWSAVIDAVIGALLPERVAA